MKKSALRELGAFVPDEPENVAVEWETKDGEKRRADIAIRHLSFSAMEKLEAGTPGFLARLVMACAVFDGEQLTQAEVEDLDPRFARALVQKILAMHGSGSDAPND